MKNREREVSAAFLRWGGALGLPFDFRGWGLSPLAHGVGLKAVVALNLLMHACLLASHWLQCQASIKKSPPHGQCV